MGYIRRKVQDEIECLFCAFLLGSDIIKQKKYYYLGASSFLMDFSCLILMFLGLISGFLYSQVQSDTSIFLQFIIKMFLLLIICLYFLRVYSDERLSKQQRL